MKKSQYTEVTADYDYDPIKPKKVERPLGTLRVAKVTYDHHPIAHSTNGVTLGQMIDAHIAQTLQDGTLVSEVSLIFETVEQQHELAAMYT